MDSVGYFTGVLALIAGLQWITLEKTDHTLKETLAANKLAQRAFVAVREITIVPVGRFASKENDAAYRIGAVWENSGTTQAESLEIDFVMALMPKSDIPSWDPDGNGIKYVLLPRAIVEAGTLNIDGANINTVRDGKLFIFYQALAKYRDAFGGKHLTMACFRILAAPVDYTKEGSKGVSGIQCERYNCTDNDCRRYESLPPVKKALKFLE